MPGGPVDATTATDDLLNAALTSLSAHGLGDLVGVPVGLDGAGDRHLPPPEAGHVVVSGLVPRAVGQAAPLLGGVPPVDVGQDRNVVGARGHARRYGKQVGTVKRYSDTLLMFLLKGRRPEKFKDRHELTGKDGEPVVPVINLSQKQGKALLAP